MDTHLKRWFVAYAASALCCAIIVSAGVLVNRYAAAQLETFNVYQTLLVNKSNMKNAIKNMDVAIAQIRSEIPGDLGREALQADILVAFDDLKSRFKNCQVAIAGFQRHEDEISLPVTIRGPVTNYHKFLDDIGYLQERKFPFFFIAEIAVTKSERSDKEEKEPVVFEIKGAFAMRGILPGTGQGS
jgi:hypothetical protein